jgi:hypothetical protein
VGVEPTVIPDTREHALRGRTYEQSELSIYQEVRLAQLLSRTVERLAAQGFQFGGMLDAVDEKGEVNWQVAARLATDVLGSVPDIAVDSTLIMFGILPTNPDGSRNRQYDDERGHLVKYLKLADWIEVIKTFAEQNDVERLTRPFAPAARKAIDRGREMIQRETPPEASEGSSPPSTPSSKPATGRTRKDSSAG